MHARWSTKLLKTLSEDLSTIQQEIDTFSEHLVSLNEMEMFYGDETLASLLKHSKELSLLIEEVDLVVDTTQEESTEEEITPGID